jgi:hypothetical protein
MVGDYCGKLGYESPHPSSKGGLEMHNSYPRKEQARHEQ